MDRETLSQIIAQHDEYLLPLFEPAFKIILDSYAWFDRVDTLMAKLDATGSLTDDAIASIKNWQGSAPQPKEPLQENSSLNVPAVSTTEQRVKHERLSVCSETDENAVSLAVKTEKLEPMAAPTRPAPKSRKTKQKNDAIFTTKRVTRSKVKQKAPADDDVVIGEPPVEVIALDDESEAGDVELEEPSPNYATFVSNQAGNATFAVNATVVEKRIMANVDDLMTDDESGGESGAAGGSKRVFAPSPLKQKVEAFEKLAEKRLLAPVRVTRTKTRAQAKEEGEEKGADVNTKIDYFPTSQLKTTSALKEGQMSYLERERMRREALLSEKKLLQKEKALEVLKHRNELMEIEREKQLKVQPLKEVRSARLMEERLLAKERALEERKKEEQRLRREEEREKAKAKADERRLEAHKSERLAIYMVTEAPLLPTDDCYDSDDERCDPKKKMMFPDWTRTSKLQNSQIVGMVIGEKIKNSYFSVQAQTPDLQDIFEVIQKHKLVRRSSANWQKAPRFSMMPPAWTKN